MLFRSLLPSRTTPSSTSLPKLPIISTLFSLSTREESSYAPSLLISLPSFLPPLGQVLLLPIFSHPPSLPPSLQSYKYRPPVHADEIGLTSDKYTPLNSSLASLPLTVRRSLAPSLPSSLPLFLPPSLPPSLLPSLSPSFPPALVTSTLLSTPPSPPSPFGRYVAPCPPPSLPPSYPTVYCCLTPPSLPPSLPLD